MQFTDYLIAHRGYPVRLPENTMPSIEAALQAGARYVEVDVQMSQDGEVVLFHDRQLQRLCHQPGAVHDYRWQELQSFRVSDDRHGTVNAQAIPIPHLRDLVSLLQQRPDITVFIELKRVSLEQFGIQVVVEQVLSLLQPIKNQVVLISYSLEAIQFLRQISDVSLGVVIDDWDKREHTVILDVQPEYLFCKLDSIPVKGDLSSKAYQLVVFECTDPHQAYSLLKRGANLVETFAIGEMLTAMTEIGVPLE